MRQPQGLDGLPKSVRGLPGDPVKHLRHMEQFFSPGGITSLARRGTNLAVLGGQITGHGSGCQHGP